MRRWSSGKRPWRAKIGVSGSAGGGLVDGPDIRDSNQRRSVGLIQRAVKQGPSAMTARITPSNASCRAIPTRSNVLPYERHDSRSDFVASTVRDVR